MVTGLYEASVELRLAEYFMPLHYVYGNAFLFFEDFV